MHRTIFNNIMKTKNYMKKNSEPLQAAASEKRSDSNAGKPVFIDLTRDLGFKIVLADPDHPELLRRFLNELIPERTILSVTLLNTQAMPSAEDDKRTCYDIHCVDSEGNRFLVEMQKQPYDHFNDRLMVYSGDPLKHLLKLGESYAEVRTLYVVSILGGYLQVDGEDSSVRHELIRHASVRMENGGKVLSDKLKYIFLQLPMAETLSEGASFIEKWAYYVRNIGGMREKPQDTDPYFDLLFEAANRRNIEQGKLSIYDKMLRDEIQIEAEKQYALKEQRKELQLRAEAEKREAVEAARQQGIEKGFEKGIAQTLLETARKMKAAGISVDLICQCTQLTIEQVEAL